ncbi:response regulator transcription factor [Paenibacillus sp. oral taxon 786]|uniref:response regulator transcription factor n=1 Tax=Paenibacillus sp. oral taxon 786 TaxID=652715 RepID=UPI001E648E86|nr:response regulator transcription factor [Paenibacillus sp. oral taxon 786]
MIIDDEPKQRLGLQTLIPWSDLGYEVVGTASSGKEALQSLEQDVPDLLVVDIRMPGMDGLQLLQEIRQRGWKVHAVVLSGYADFEYARRAMQYGVEGYLLKPVNKQEMSALLEKLHARLVEQQAQQNKTYTREWLVYSLLSGSLDEKEDLDKLSASLGLVWSKYQIVLLDFSGIGSEEDERIVRFRERLNKICASDRNSVVLSMTSSIVLLLGRLHAGKFERERFYREMYLLAEDLRDEMNMAAGEVVHSLSEIPMSFHTARSLLDRSFFYDRGQLLTPETPVCYSMVDQRGEIPAKEDLAFRLSYYVEVGQTEMIRTLLDRIAARMVHQGEGEEEVRKRFFYLASEAVRNVPVKVWDEAGYEGGGASLFLANLSGARTFRELVDKVGDVLERLARCTNYCSRGNEIRRMLDYIDRHYEENLKLETLSEVFNYSSSYLGQLFKNETGEYFNAYLDKVRIEKAKQLLRQGMKVYEVAEQVGYANVNYFHHKFKKLVGHSPSSYQKKADLKNDGAYRNDWRSWNEKCQN